MLDQKNGVGQALIILLHIVPTSQSHTLLSTFRRWLDCNCKCTMDEWAVCVSTGPCLHMPLTLERKFGTTSHLVNVNAATEIKRRANRHTMPLVAQYSLL